MAKTEPPSGKLADHTRAHLEEILARAEFQPRGNTKSWSERLGDRLGSWFMEQIRGILEQFEGWKSDPSTGWFARWLTELGDWIGNHADLIFGFFKILGYLIAFAVVVGFAYLLFKHLDLKSFILRSNAKRGERRPVEPEKPLTPSEYLAMGNPRLALVRLRDILRAHIGAGLSHYRSLTDKELCSLADSHSMAHQLFGEVSLAFEQTFFAGLDPQEAELHRLCHMHLSLKEMREI